MPKRHGHLRVPASLLRAWIDAGKVEVISKAGSSLLQLFRPIYLTFPLVYARGKRKPRRMWVPAGSFLNSRWIPLGSSNSEWRLIESLGEQELKERYIIVRIEDQGEFRWYRLIYEIVSSRSQLLRQRIHIRSHHDRERRVKQALLKALEREFADHALGKARISRAQLDELHSIARRLQDRISKSLPSIQAYLSGRDTIAFFDWWLEIEGLKGHRDRLSRAVDNLSAEAKKRFFDAFLNDIANRLAIYVSPEIRRSVRWARYHVLKAADNVLDDDVSSCKYHLLRSVDHLEVALNFLQSWSESLSEEERKFIPQF